MLAKELHLKLEVALLLLVIASFLANRINFQIENNYFISSYQVDLYGSPAKDLVLLPGVGPQVASKIIALRGSVDVPETLLRTAGVSILNVQKIFDEKLIKDLSQENTE